MLHVAILTSFLEMFRSLVLDHLLVFDSGSSPLVLSRMASCVMKNLMDHTIPEV